MKLFQIQRLIWEMSEQIEKLEKALYHNRKKKPQNLSQNRKKKKEKEKTFRR